MSLPANDQTAIADLARKYHLSESAVAHLLDAIRRGGGSAAQFNHPELGGMGQWMASGMMMIGDWNNHALKATIAQLCADLVPLAAHAVAPAGSGFPAFPSFGASAPWWPTELGSPTASGAQNGVRYAYFAAARRLALEIAGRVTVYDTLDHRIAGVAQQQGAATTLSFQSQRGVVTPGQLPRVAEYDL
ncbi:SHOCT domain-containing protein [Chloroflexales bacterium ZM16-3]|nr:SHOCT domain-containing protein [Chloroflexales bacterium ZM16-3]